MSESPIYIRRRVYIACVNCRKRKIKCLTEESEKKALRQYMPVSEGQAHSVGPKGRAIDKADDSPPPAAPRNAPVHTDPALNLSLPYGYHSQSNGLQPQYMPVSPMPVHATPSTDSHPWSTGSHSQPANLHQNQRAYQLPPGYDSVRASANAHPALPPGAIRPQKNAAFVHPNNSRYYQNDWAAPFQSSPQPQRCPYPQGPCYCGGHR
ncbi:hypothetical protein DFH09DRAFT_1293560 [Mycena vulgaris]|nr:hypothetical protein DFH09DRAFT_1293560 [Mycena vulgaris]